MEKFDFHFFCLNDFSEKSNILCFFQKNRKFQKSKIFEKYFFRKNIFSPRKNNIFWSGFFPIKVWMVAIDSARLNR